VFRRARPYWQRYRRWLVATGVAALAALLPVLPLVVVRADLGGGAVSTERRSVDERVLNVRDSLQMLAAHPLLGAGAGAYVLVLSTMLPAGVPLEPVHSVPLLIAAETGLLGAAAVLVLSAGIGWRVWRRRRAAGVGEWVWALALAAIVAGGLLDHFWWTAPPAQLAFTTVLGLWVGAGTEKR
ncbi:MAG: O-antigen ligase family protein, partial [Anaerolineales bacterium]